MGFLYPSFLWALAATAIPVLIHLFNFRAYKTVYFSNSVFLENIITETKQGARIRDLLLLALRIGVIIFMVLAFARPVIHLGGQAVSNLSSKLTVVFIDNSFSMGLQTKHGTLLEIARQECAVMVGRNSPDQRYLLLTGDFKGLDDRPLFRRELLERLGQIIYSPYSRTLTQVLDRGAQAAASLRVGSPQFVFFSDFQRNTVAQHLSGNVTLVPVRPVKEEIKDVSIDSIWFTSPVFRPGLRAAVVVRRSRTQGFTGWPRLTMKVNGSLTALGTSRDIEARSSKQDTLAFSPARAGIQNLEFEIADNSLAFDNTLYAAVNVRPSASILLLHGIRKSLFLNAVYKGDPFFKIQEDSEDQINYSLFAAQNLVIADRLKNLSSGLALELGKFIARGGTFFYIPSLETPLGVQRSFLESLKVDYPVKFVSSPAKVLHINTRLDLFRGVFESIPGNATLPSANRYFKFSTNRSAVSEPVFRLSSGDNLLTRYSLGKGSCFVSAAPFEDSSQTTQRQDLFVPLMYQIVLWNAGERSYYTIGADKRIESSPTASAQVAVSGYSPGYAAVTSRYKLIGRGTEIIPENRTTPAGSYLYIADQPDKPGFYALMGSKQQALQGYAFNYNRSESRLEYYTDKELAALTGFEPNTSTSSMLASASDQLGKANASAPGYMLDANASWLWKLCLIIALALLAAEELTLYFKPVGTNDPQ